MNYDNFVEPCRGFCGAPDSQEGGEGNGEFTDDVEGTGMGEGQGKEDVSEQIEDEEQVGLPFPSFVSCLHFL